MIVLKKEIDQEAVESFNQLIKKKNRRTMAEAAGAAGGDTIACLTTKEIKALARPEFQANPEKFYPTNVFARIGFTRATCECGNYYWRHTEARTTCGDSK